MGTFMWKDGKTYKGPWVNGKQHGKGTFVFPNGKEKLGEWANGKRLRWFEE